MSMCRVDLQLIYSNRNSLSCSQPIKCSKRTDKASPETNLFVVIPVSCNNNNATVRIIPSLGFVLPCVILEQLLSFPERTGRRKGSDATKRADKFSPSRVPNFRCSRTQAKAVLGMERKHGLATKTTSSHEYHRLHAERRKLLTIHFILGSSKPAILVRFYTPP